MPHTVALAALLHALREEVAWLLTQADDFARQEPETAARYIHRARNLQAVLDGYERLQAKSA